MKNLFIFLTVSLAASLALALPNPAALYCERLGYDYRIVETPGGARGVVTVEPGVEFDAWDFFKGKVGSKYSYGALFGYDTECVIEDKGGYVEEYAVCFAISGGKRKAQIPLLELMEQNGDPLIVPPAYNRSGLSRGAGSNAGAEAAGQDVCTREIIANKALPAQFDWRNKDGHCYIGPIRDQGSCGSCYAFAANAAAESVYNWATGKYDGNCADFSESFIIWCLGRMDAYCDHFYGCDGADYEYAELTALTEEGVGNESDFPYTTTDPGTCTHSGDTTTLFKSWGRIDCGDIEAIKTAIMTFGAVDAAVDAGSSFSSYGSGVFEDSLTNCNGTPCYYTPVNHAIALVGWDDAPAEGGGGCWILRNSWGESWGESGYMRIRFTSARVACEACYLSFSTNIYSLTVASEYCGSVPAAGVHLFDDGRKTTCMVTNSPITSGTTQYACLGWTGSGSTPANGTGTNTGCFSMTNNASITWLWGTNVYLCLNTGDHEYGTVSPTSSWVAIGSSLSVTASPSDYCHFVSWGGDTDGCVIVSNTITAPMNHARSIDANFAPDELSAPTGIAASDGTFSDKVQITWSTATSAASYEVWRSQTNLTDTANLLAETTDTSWDDTSAVVSQLYFYWVKAENPLTTSAFSSPDTGYMGTGMKVVNDFDGDGKSDIAVYDSDSGWWYILYSSSFSLHSLKFGGVGYKPKQGDFDGDQRADAAVYHEASGYWSILYSSDWSLSVCKFGEDGYSPVAGDFDGDGRSDPAVYHEASGYWFILYSGNLTLASVKLGEPGYTAVPGDFDGDGRSDPAVYHEASGYWFILYSGNLTLGCVKLGEPGYTAATGDFDGDGRSDPAVYHEESGYWYVLLSSSGDLLTQKLGAHGYSPIQ